MFSRQVTLTTVTPPASIFDSGCLTIVPALERTPGALAIGCAVHIARFRSDGPGCGHGRAGQFSAGTADAVAADGNFQRLVDRWKGRPGPYVLVWLVTIFARPAS